MTIQEFAKAHRLKVRLDDCGDPVIYGSIRQRDGVKAERQLYFDGDRLCLMILDGAVINIGRFEALGAGYLWTGDISRDSSGRRVQDVKIKGIPLEKANLAIRLVNAKRKKNVSDAVLASTAKAFAASPLSHRSRKPPETR